MGTLALILLPAAAFVGVVALVYALRRDRATHPDRPWWGRPIPWIAISAAFVLLGLFVFPRLLGFTFLFLPLLWVGGLGRRRQDPGRRKDPGGGWEDLGRWEDPGR